MKTSKQKLITLMKDLIQVSNDYDKTFENITLIEDKPEDHVLEDIYQLLTTSIPYKNKGIPQKHFIDLNQNISDRYEAVFERLLNLCMNEPDAFEQFLADKELLDLFCYLFFLDCVHQLHFFQKEAYQALGERILTAADSAELKEAFYFMMEREDAGKNRFYGWQMEIDNNQYTISKYELDALNLPYYVRDFVKARLIAQLLKQIMIIENSFERVYHLNTMFRQFQIYNLDIDSPKMEYLSVLSLSYWAERHTQVHGIFPLEQGLWLNQTLTFAEIHLYMLPLLSVDGAMIDEAQMIRHARVLDRLIKAYSTGQYKVSTMDEHRFWASCQVVFIYSNHYPLKLVDIYLKNMSLLKYGLFKYGDLGRIHRLSLDYLTLSTNFAFIIDKVDPGYEMLHAFLKPLDAIKDIGNIADMNLNILPERRKKETGQDYDLRYVLAILMEISVYFLHENQLEKMIAVYEKIIPHLRGEFCKPLGLQYQLEAFKEILVQTLSIQKSGFLSDDFVPKMLDSHWLLLRHHIDYFDDKIKKDFRNGMFSYIEKVLLNQKKSMRNPQALVNAHAYFKRVFDLFKSSPRDLKRLDKALSTTDLEDLKKSSEEAADALLKGEQQEKKKKQEQKAREQKALEQKALEQKALEQQRLLTLEKEKSKTIVLQTAEPSDTKSPQESKHQIKNQKKKKKKRKKKQKQSTDLITPFISEIADTQGAQNRADSGNILSFFEKRQTISNTKLPQALLELSFILNKKWGQYLVLTGGAVESLALGDLAIKDYDCLIRHDSLEDLKFYLSEKGYSQLQLVGRHQVLRLYVDDIEIEISLLKSAPGHDLLSSLKADALTRDIISTAMYLVLNEDPKRVIYDPLNALPFLQQKQIRLNAQEDFFKKDPIRILRVLKSQLKRPQFQLCEPSQKILANIDQQTLWKSYLVDKNAYSLHRGRTQTALTHLLNKFPLEELLSHMDKLGLLQALLGITESAIAFVLDLYQQIKHEDKFYKFKLATACVFFFNNKNNKHICLHDWPFFLTISDKDNSYPNIVYLSAYYIENTTLDLQQMIDAKQMIDYVNHNKKILDNSGEKKEVLHETEAACHSGYGFKGR